ncbi:MAG: uroporphyrinogen-III synthase, partial [Actinobacteria bacterium]|nr:uroporphyrinogen-III synthase [Actinomycetota bacterium]
MRVALTRPDGQNEELAARLRRAGHEVGVHPLIAIEPLGDDPVGLDGYDWLVVTSANGAVELARRAVGRPARIAAVGDATAAVLREAGFDVDLIPARSSQEGLLEELPASPGRVLLAAASDARTLLLERTGA